MKLLDLSENIYGKLIVTSEAPRRNGNRYWNCICDCGNEITTLQASLRRGKTTSCGCYRKKVTGNARRKHGDSQTRLYIIWQNMRRRCQDPKNSAYHNYGGRGITVIATWEKYEVFKNWALSAGYKNNLTIDRRKNNDNYTPDNCRWVDRMTQARNKRKRLGLSSKFIGVTWDKSNNSWQAAICIKGKIIKLGRFSDEVLAASTRDKYILNNNLSNFTLNFP